MGESYAYIFGPVPSRRLGISLGVDLVTPKVCSMDCVYCESGKTTHLTLKRKPYVTPEQVIDELSRFLRTDPKLDYITFSGSGEPMLNSCIGEVIRFIKSDFPHYRIALLTNSSLFYQEKARRDVSDVDLIVASLDAVSPDVFKKLNRPVPMLEPDMIIQGLVKLRKEFNHELWLEIFIVPGLNDTDDELNKLSQISERINPNRIQINTIDRPGTETWVKPVDMVNFERIKSYFKSIEIVAPVTYREKVSFAADSEDIEEKILFIIARRPCTIEDITESIGIHHEIIQFSIRKLLQDHKITTETMERGVFYKTL